MSFTSVTYFLFVGISLLIYTIVPSGPNGACCWVPARLLCDGSGTAHLWLVAAILIVYGGGLLLGHLNDQAKPGARQLRQRGKKTNSQKI